ncbi:CATRA conflict system CASPASE/TPR repeat-associated protein [Actinoplanes sp. NPDC048967]|uniref:CATRA conflict system CASPASE/TPR repeat-associated protein n=1 Tax=Actinoplanes sp. NPDC048967 TaxID=3155269 RepID=UPI0033CBE63D
MEPVEPRREPAPIDPVDRQDARRALADLPRWSLTGAQWAEVGETLQQMVSALVGADGGDFAAATAELEALSPLRVVPIAPDAEPVGPVPKSLRLRLLRLVHLLDGAGPPPGPPVAERSAAPPPAGGAAPQRQELVVHVFAPLDGPWSEPAYQQLLALWGDAVERSGTTAAIDGLPLDPPTAGPLVPRTRTIAARQRPDRLVQAVLRREQDALILSIAWSAGADGPGWDGPDVQWSAIAARGTDLMLGVVLIFLGTYPGADEEPPSAPGELWTGGRTRLGSCSVWELPPFDDAGRAERRLLILAPPRDESHLSLLAWSRGDTAVTPFLRYLLDAAAYRYQLRVHQAVAAGVLTGDEKALAVTQTLLRDLRLTVEIARSNMAQARAALDRAGPADVLFDDDLETADWVQRRLDDDISYLENARERARLAGPAHGSAGPPTFGLVTAMEEEFAAMRTMIDDAEVVPVAGDSASYVRGTIPSIVPGRPHQVVLTLLGGTATDAAATGATHLLRSFSSVDQVLMVGIAAGIPRPELPDRHVRLGDIVVSTWGVAEYDHVVDRPDGTSPRQGFPRPSPLLGPRARMLRAEEHRRLRPWVPHLERLIAELPEFDRPDPATDVLYASDDEDAEPVEHPVTADRLPGLPKVHLGRIGSGDRSVRNAALRDKLARDHTIIALEMEGSGIGSATFAGGRHWLIVRGISDYADRRMTLAWRRYAAAVAAAYTRALLESCPPVEPHGGRTGGEPPGA